MNSRVAWSVEGIDPSVRARAEAAARRAGMTLGQWLNSMIGEASLADFIGDRTPAAADPRQRDVAAIHQRLDTIARQINDIAEPATNEPLVARQLNEAIARLDARLSAFGEQAQSRPVQAPARPPYADNPTHYHTTSRTTPLPTPSPLDSAIAEITARQLQLDDAAPRPAARRAGPRAADFMAINDHLHNLTSRIDALRPDRLDESIGGFRSDLAEIRGIITEAMPRRAIESIEREVLALSQRVNEFRNNGTDAKALSGVERALTEIKGTLSTLTPAEKLAGFSDAIRNLGDRIDQVVRNGDSSTTVQQLEGAISALRSIVSTVASNESLERLQREVQTLAARIDELARADNHSDSFRALERRLTTLTESLAQREQAQPMAAVHEIRSEQLESALHALSTRLDNLPVGNDSSNAIAHLEQRISYLLERIEAAPARSPELGQVERSLQEVQHHLERQQAAIIALADRAAAPQPAAQDYNPALQDIFRHLDRQQSAISALAERSIAPAPVEFDQSLLDNIKRELADMRYGQTETDRNTQDSLEVVHNTLGHVVDRLAIIEGDLRNARKTQVSAATPPAPQPPAGPGNARPPAPAPHDVSRVEAGPGPVTGPDSNGPSASNNSRARSSGPSGNVHGLIPMDRGDHADVPQGQRPLREILSPPPVKRGSSNMIDDSLPPDHPLEPGSRPVSRQSASERIAASEEVISSISGDHHAPVSTSSFIAAARRAAQAAAAENPTGAASQGKPAKQPKPAKGVNKTGSTEIAGVTVTSKIRSLLVGASVVAIVLGSFQMAMTVLDKTDGTTTEVASEPEHKAPARPDTAIIANVPPHLAPIPPPTGVQDTLHYRAPSTVPSAPAPTAETPMPPQTASRPDIADVTGSIPRDDAIPTRQSSAPAVYPTVSIPANEKLPETIGSAALRTAAIKGDATAVYEIAVRYADGKGVPADINEAAKWFERAGRAGVVPAQFRLGTLYEKGLAGKKNLEIARQLYLQAAERGNGKAMHNLAVLDADGGAKGPDFKSAAHWFRKAAERGVADSQYNLGILYARGIGIEPNIAESYKWFSLAAKQGDDDAGRKRDDIVKRLDPQSLAAAKLAVQTFIPESQPDDAVNVAKPAGGWDAPTATSKPAKRATR